MNLETRDLAWFKARHERGAYDVVDLTHREAMALHIEVTSNDPDAAKFEPDSVPVVEVPPGCSGVILGVPFRIRDD